MKSFRDIKGQSAVEFVLTAPFLFLILFCVIQMAYLAFVSLAVQRAALAVARKASLSASENTASFKTQLALSLLPIAGLSPKALLTLTEADYKVIPSMDHKQITVRVRYPILIWVPLIRNLIGEPLFPSPMADGTPEEKAIKMIFAILKRKEPDPPLAASALRVKWIRFEETTFNEGYQAP